MKTGMQNGVLPAGTARNHRKRNLLVTTLTAAVLFVTSQASANAKPVQTVLPVVSVALFTSGVGFFRHSGDVDGPIQVTLPFKEGEINDVLKSLVLDTPASEPAGFAVFPSQQPLDRLLKGFLVDLSGHPTLANILAQLRGTPVHVSYQGKEINGRIIGVEQRPLTLSGEPKNVVMDWFINLATNEGLRAIPLRDLEQVGLAKGETLGDLVKALDALEQAGGHERKNLQLSFPGSGKRRVAVGYVVESSIWKSGYRLMLPRDSTASPQAVFHGWAIVENQTDNDWNNVRLSLVSGRPISFVQELYSPRYANRPRVSDNGEAEIVPVRHDRGIPVPARQKQVSIEARERSSLMVAPAAAPVPETGERSDEEAAASSDSPPLADVAPQLVTSADESSGGVSVRFDVEGVDLPRRRGAMIPFMTRSVPMERISLFNSKNHSSHPFRGVLLENNSDLHLPAGPVTLFDGDRYAGDALLNDLPPGQKGLLTHALDQEVEVLVVPKTHSGRLTSGRIAKGVLKLTRRNLSRHEYTLKNNAKENRTVLIEHARMTYWNLVKPENPFETTSNLYRFRQVMAPGEEKQLNVVEERIREQKVRLVGNLSSVIFSYASEEGFSDQLKGSLDQAARLQGRVEEMDRKLNELTRELRSDGEEQARVRANISTIPAGTAFYNRMIAKMDTMENAIEKKNAEVARLKAEKETARKHLETFVDTLEM